MLRAFQRPRPVVRARLRGNALAGVLLTVAAVGAAVATLMWRSDALESAARARWREQLGAVTDATRNTLGAWRAERERDLRVLTQLLARGSPGPPYDLDSLANDAGFSRLWVIAAEQALADAGLDSLTGARARELAVRALRDTGLYAAGPVTDSGRPAFLLARQLAGRGPPTALLAAVDPIPTARDFLAGLPRLTASDEYRLIADIGGILHLLASSDSSVGPTAALSSAAGMIMAQGDTFGEFTTPDGTRILAAVRPLVGDPWGVLGRVAVDDAYASARGRLWRETIAAAALLGLVTVAGATARSEIRRQRVARDAATASLARTTERHRQLVESAVVGILEMDPRGRLRAANPALAGMLGYDSPEELLALEHIRRCYADAERAGASLAGYLEADVVRGHETWWLKRDGSRLVVRLTGRQLRAADGTVTAVELFVEDVTERRSLEVQLQHAQKMEIIGQLAGGIAHDFNNLLTAILGGVEMLGGLLAGGHEGRDDLNDIRNAAQRGAALVKKLMTVGRRQELSVEALSLGTVVQDMLGMVRRVVPARIHIDLRIAPDLPRVRADRMAIEQILLNLVTNARDAIAQDGTITIDVLPGGGDAPRRDAPSLDAAGSWQILRVSDTGQGMDERTAAQVFEPFFTTKEPGAGTGLGMAVVYGLVRQLGGAAHLETSPGTGAVISIVLPVAGDSVTAATVGAPAAASPAGTETILLVEDDPMVRQLAQRVLQRAGYTVRTAPNGQEAIGLLRARPGAVALVVSDIVMPVMGGMRLLTEVAKLPPPAPRVLLTSGHAPEEGGTVPAGQPFLRKPWTPTQLLQAVRDAIDM